MVSDGEAVSLTGDSQLQEHQFSHEDSCSLAAIFHSVQTKHVKCTV